jgi:hypothetical protein
LLKQHFNKLPQIDYRLVVPEDVGNNCSNDPSDPNNYKSEAISLCRYSFKDYVCQIDDFPRDFFDVISIDGRARPSCIAHSFDKVKSGGFLILDNADRPYYTAKTDRYLTNFECRKFFGVVPGNLNYLSQTNIYRKL